MALRLKRDQIPAQLRKYFRDTCNRCYLCHSITVLRLLRRVLRKDGVVFWDIDDTRAGSGGGGPAQSSKTMMHGTIKGSVPAKPKGALPAKNLTLIPERVALAAQADGWIVRSIAVIPTWMPESAQDRPTDAYRRVLIMAKSAKYYWDAAAVRTTAGLHREGRDHEDYVKSAGRRNLGNILDFPPSSSGLPGSHFAAFPLAEPELFIKAACPERVCQVCGRPSVRIVKRNMPPTRAGVSATPDGQTPQGFFSTGRFDEPIDYETTGWTDCGHDAYLPGIVLDPFAGTGTTLVAARKLSRKAIGIEASPEFVAGCVERLRRGDDGLKAAHELKAAGAEQPVLL